ncbi:BON domain-containing protein [Flavobacterium sp. FPG59]|jgi:osmotically-inducible protein OsmY|uniref:BON domain-containing protein n=1 Tax=Flavobacterium sp. FPG59 TaxID=1929267 RepID=UPI000A3D6232|nr:BON domain-containing protein [Flavobacterium sp. FPG59]OUD36853.1 ornithine aminotransferase [Flavobacterium sp. FPG59]
MKSNEELQKNVVDAINWEPLLQAAEIGVMTNRGVVTLTGSVNTYAKKNEAEQAAKNVAGVATVLEDIKVVCGTDESRPDTEIKNVIENIFMWHWDIPTEKIKVLVENGWVFLSGQLEWNYQKEATKNALNNLIGITGITNNIKIISSSKDTIKKKDIEIAIDRNCAIKNKDIRVYVVDNVVTLIGHVDSCYQKNEASRIAWNAPGVTQVQNDLYIEFDD